MTTSSFSATTGPELERELLARLGLTSGANALEVQSAHDDLVDYLERAPGDLRSWAKREIELADEAYALLSDPTADLAAIAAANAPVPAPAGVTAPVAPQRAAVAPAPVEDDDYIEELDPEAGRPRKAKRAAVGAGAVETVPARPAGIMNSVVGRVAIIAGAIVAIGAIVVIGFNFGGGGGSGIPGVNGTPAPEAAASPTIDQARVAALMQKISDDPKDVASLQELGDIYFRVEDYQTAAGWMEKIIAIDPQNVTAYLALGAALFNSSDVAGAEKNWRKALEIDPKNVEAHYDLGFMYLSQEPPDIERTRAEWNKVIEIDPDSDIAQTVQQHLGALDQIEASAAPSGSPAASGAPQGSPSPAASGTPKP